MIPAVAGASEAKSRRGRVRSTKGIWPGFVSGQGVVPEGVEHQNEATEGLSLHDWFFRQGGGRKRFIDWLGIDSWIDSSLAETWQSLQDRWNAVSSFFARFRLSGWKRLLNEAIAEGLTLGVGGFAVLYVLAIPALNDFDENRINTGKFAVKFLDRNGTEIGQRGILHNDAVPLEEIPDHLIKATLATEDRRFFEHFGVDFIGTARALFENARANEVVQGGSTLTQQLAKNLFLSSERSVQRKLKEVFLAFLLESRFTKREILKLYLDRAYLGGGAFGVEAASQFYFGKSVREVNLAEAALMAGLFKAPSKFAPHINLPASRARTNDVLTNLVEAGYMSAGQVQAARLNPAKIIDTRPTHSPDWFLDWAFEEAQRLGEGRGALCADGAHDRRSGHAAGGAGRADQQPAPHGVEPPQGLHRRAGVHGARRRRPRHGGRPRLRGQPVQPRRPCPPPAGLLVQALRLCHGVRERHQPALDGARLRRRVRELVAQELLRRQLGPLAGRPRRLPHVAQRAGRQRVAARRPREGGGDDPAPRRRRREEDVLHGARRHRHHAAAAHGRLCPLRQRRQDRQALRHPGDVQFQGRPDLQPRPRRAAAGRRS